jgi:hypothetical protein
LERDYKPAAADDAPAKKKADKFNAVSKLILFLKICIVKNSGTWFS